MKDDTAADEILNVSTNDELEVDVEKNTQILQEIQKKFKTATTEQKHQIKDILKENNCSKLDVNVLSTKAFEQILSVLD